MSYKVLDVCNYIISYSHEKNYEITNPKLQKLLYFIQGFFLLKKNTPCFLERIEAWNSGPIIPLTQKIFKPFEYDNIPDCFNFSKYHSSADIISEEDKKLINQVIYMFSEFPTDALIELTKKQSPWIKTYEPYQINIISRKLITEYFLSEFPVSII